MIINLIEVEGNDMIAEARERIEHKVHAAVQLPVQVFLWGKPDIVLTPVENTSIGNLLRTGWERGESQMIQEWPNLK